MMPHKLYNQTPCAPCSAITHLLEGLEGVALVEGDGDGKQVGQV